MVRKLDLPQEVRYGCAPGTYNFTLQRRADYSLDLQFKDNSDAAVDLTGYTIYAQAWNEAQQKVC